MVRGVGAERERANKGGSIGGYTGGLDIKRTLMSIEGIPFEEEQHG